MNLLDVNVLLALLWPTHPDFAVADAWFRSHSQETWATCALTQSGFIRISAQNSFKHGGRSLDAIAAGLEMATASVRHRFLTIDFSFKTVGEICTGGVIGHRQITDAYLLALAVKSNAKFVTLDTGVRQLLATEKERASHLTVLEG